MTVANSWHREGHRVVRAVWYSRGNPIQPENATFFPTPVVSCKDVSSYLAALPPPEPKAATGPKPASG